MTHLVSRVASRFSLGKALRLSFFLRCLPVCGIAAGDSRPMTHLVSRVASRFSLGESVAVVLFFALPARLWDRGRRLTPDDAFGFASRQPFFPGESVAVVLFLALPARLRDRGRRLTPDDAFGFASRQPFFPGESCSSFFSSPEYRSLFVESAAGNPRPMTHLVSRVASRFSWETGVVVVLSFSSPADSSWNLGRRPTPDDAFGFRESPAGSLGKCCCVRSVFFRRVSFVGLAGP